MTSIEPEPSFCDVCGEEASGRPVVTSLLDDSWAHSDCLNDTPDRGELVDDPARFTR